MRRFSIRALMAFIVISAIGLAAIRNCSPVWAGAMLSLTFFAMICSLLGIAFRRDRRRVFWTGFAVLGWSYLLLAFVPMLYTHLGQYLLASNLMEVLGDLIHTSTGMQSVPVVMLGAPAMGGGFGGGKPDMDFMNCARMAMALEALLWAVLGGYIATYFASDRVEGTQAPSGNRN